MATSKKSSKPTAAQQQIIDAINAGPPSAGASSQLQPIGVPAQVAATDKNGTLTAVPFTATLNGQQVGIRYYSGDEWAPANQSPQDIAAVQMQLVAAGLIPQGASYHPGIWDDTTRSAYTHALGYANSTGLDASAALNVLASSGSTKQQTVPQTHLLPDLASVAQDVKTMVSQKLGRDATPEEVRALSSRLQGYDQQAVAQQDAAAASTGGSVQAVDPTAEFQQYLDTQYAPEIQRTKGMAEMAQDRTNFLSNVLTLDSTINQAKTA